MYSRVIVPLDGSELGEAALPRVRLIAAALSVPIELVRAVDASSAVTGREQQNALEYLSGVRDSLRQGGHAASTTVAAGTPAEVIVQCAGSDPDALIVMSTHGRGGIARLAMGSVTDRVLQHAPNPLLIVRPTGSSGGAPPRDVMIRKVLAPLDGSPLAELSLPHAAGLAAGLGAAVELVRVTAPPAETGRHIATASGQADAEEPEAYLDRMRRTMALEHPQASPVDVCHLRHENTAHAIIKRADAGASLVVMSTHGRSGINRLVLGSVTDQVVRHANAPVLVVRRWDEPGYTGLEEWVSQGYSAGFGNAASQPA